MCTARLAQLVERETFPFHFQSYEFPDGKSGSEGVSFCLEDKFKFRSAEIELFLFNAFF